MVSDWPRGLASKYPKGSDLSRPAAAAFRFSDASPYFPFFVSALRSSSSCCCAAASWASLHRIRSRARSAWPRRRFAAHSARFCPSQCVRSVSTCRARDGRAGWRSDEMFQLILLESNEPSWGWVPGGGAPIETTRGGPSAAAATRPSTPRPRPPSPATLRMFALPLVSCVMGRGSGGGRRQGRNGVEPCSKTSVQVRRE